MKSVVPYNFRRFYYRIMGQVPALVSLLMIVIITFLLLISLNIHFSLKEKLQMEKAETDKVRLRSQILGRSGELIKSELDETNKLFTLLIPDKEDFFSIIFALEAVSKKSGFIIKDYSVNLAGSTKEKLAISVSGTGDPNTFVNFLDNYSFSGGRFITSEEIEFTNSEFKSTKILLNFYSKKVLLSTNVVPQLTRKDLDYLNEIKKKISFDFIGSGPREEKMDFNYPTKTNPF